MILSIPAPGVCVWLTGLSGSGKTTTARKVIEILPAPAGLLLDGDEIRATLSPGLGFTRADREINIARVAALARDAVDRRQIVLCALVSPYGSMRARARALIGPDRFIEVYVATPVDVCRQRDPKGLYRRSTDGDLTGLTGVDDPYEPPADPELTLDTVGCSVEENARRVVALIEAVTRRLAPALAHPP
jgi:sulfate adenylyltransferase